MEVALRSGRREILYWGDLVSGALIMSAVERAKDFTINRIIETGIEEDGVGIDDIYDAIEAEFDGE